MTSGDDDITIMFFDIGEKNLAYFVEKVSIKKLQELKCENIPASRRYDSNGECTPEFASLLSKVTTLGQRIGQGKVDLTADDDVMWHKKRIITNKFLIRLTNYLIDLQEQGIFNTVQYFIIEQQLTKATNNILIQCHIRSFLIQQFMSFRPIICFAAKHKTQVLGAPRKLWNTKKGKLVKMTKAARKKWSSDKGRLILESRRDTDGLNIIFAKQGKRKAKSDDLCDCLNSIVAWEYLVFIDSKTQYLHS